MAEKADRIRVLVISDSRPLCTFIVESVLLPRNYQPLLTPGRAKGVRKALARSPDLILLDQEVLENKGSAVLEALRDHPFQLPIILIVPPETAAVDVAHLRLGVRDCVVRPLGAEQLQQSIQRVNFEVNLRREGEILARQLSQTKGQLKQRLVELNVLHEIGRSITAPVPLDVLLERIADAALYLTQAEKCVLTLTDPETGELREQASEWPTRGVVRPLTVSSPAEKDQHVGVAAMLHVPLRVGEKEIGVLSVSNKGRPRAFDEQAKKRLRILADYAAIAIENLRLRRLVAPAPEPEEP